MNGSVPYPEPSTRLESSANRKAAKAAGLTRYIGCPCRKCGGRERQVYTSLCVPCHAKSNAERTTRKREDPMYRLRESQRDFYRHMRNRIEQLERRAEELYA